MSYKEKLSSITTFIFDVDGVLTDGSVHILNNEVFRTLNSRDGYALQYAAKIGYDIFIITGGNSTSISNRLMKSGVREVVLQSSKKVDVYENLKAKYQFKNEEVLYMGDDIPDYAVMKEVGIAACPQDAATEIKNIVDYHSPYKGGRHCVRDIIEQTLRVQGKWFSKHAHEW